MYGLSPQLRPLNVPEDIATNDRYKGAYLNRFLSSTFHAGIRVQDRDPGGGHGGDPDLADRTWTCSGSVQMGTRPSSAPAPTGSRTSPPPSPTAATWPLPRSPRSWGRATLEKYTEQAGLTGSYSISGLPTAKGSFDFDNITDGQLGWAGVGQYQDQVNPAALMIYMGAIANGGKAAEPYLILRPRAPWVCRPCPTSPPDRHADFLPTRRLPWRT